MASSLVDSVHAGAPVSARTLATMAWILRVEGCHNINWVGGDPTIHLHTIVDAIAQLPELAPGEGDLRAALPTKADWRGAFPAARTNADFLASMQKSS